MKKVLATMAVIGCLSAASTALAGIAAGTGVNGSLHDMNVIVGAQADSMGRVCVFCHTPHHAVVTDGSANLPLWNHKLTPDDQFVAYTWASPNNSNDGAFDIVDPLAGPSRLCMSCHDGSIAVDEHGSAFAQAGNGTLIGTVNHLDYAGRADLTKDLSNTHPIGFDYNDIAAYRNSKAGNGSDFGGVANAAGTEIVPSSFGYATGITINNTIQGQYNAVARNTGNNSKLISDNLYGGNIMTCATCHEVHNKENASQTAYVGGSKTVRTANGGESVQTAPNYFLYAKEDKSLICLSCHVK